MDHPTSPPPPAAPAAGRGRPARRWGWWALVALGALVAGVPAAADTQEGVTVAEDRPVVDKQYPPIVVSDPATVTLGVNPTPEECADLPSCHLVPIDVVVPDVEPADDWVMTVTVSWDDEADLDVFLWDDAQGGSYEEVGSSATGDNPESFTVFEPDLGRYNLTVINFAGGNLGWKLSAEITVNRFVPPFELLAPPPSSSTTTTTAPPTTTTAAPTTTTAAPATTTTTSPALAPAPPPVDTAPPTTVDFADQLAAPPDEVAAILEAERVVDRPSGLALFGWLVAFPLAIVGGVMAVLVRRNPMMRAVVAGSRRRAATGATGGDA